MPAPKKKSARNKTPRKQAKKGKKRQNQKKKASRQFGIAALIFSPFSFIGWLTKNMNPWYKWPVRLGASLAFIGLSLFLLAATFYFILASTYDMKGVTEMPARSEIHDRYGNILRNTKDQEVGFLHGKNRQLIKFDEVSPYFINALIAREDVRFRRHGAVDLRGVGRAIYRAFTRGKREGASTLTMQLSRNSFRLKTTNETIITGLHRKFLEIAIAYRIEANFSKDEIIEHYMNRIFWGGSIMGIGSASRTYFQKPAKDLTLSESALLAGIIRAPNAFSPFRDLKKAKRERDTVLKNMADAGFIDTATFEKALAEPLNIPTSAERLIQGSYALDSIRRDLERILEKENIKDGGLIIKTTLDPNIQRIAQEAVEKRLAQIERQPGYRHAKRSQFTSGTPAYLQGASVVIDNKTGGVLAIVGGRNASESQFNRALQSRRPVASIFKPFIFLAAFDTGMKANDAISDARLQPGEISGAPSNWSPANADGNYYRTIPAAQALVQSRNTSTIRVGNHAGLRKVIEVARQAGFSPERIDPVASAFLGHWGATVEQVASAYTIFPNGGVRYRPYYIQSIEDREGKVLFKNGPLPYRATNASSAWDVSTVLEEVNHRGTARALRSRYGFTKPSGGKTGTSSHSLDAWYAGFTSDLTCAVWVGLDQPKQIVREGTGATLALPIWADIMKAADRLPSYHSGPVTPRKAEPINDAYQGIPHALPVR